MSTSRGIRSASLSSSSSSSSDSDDELMEMLIINKVFQYESSFLNKVPMRTSALTGEGYTKELLNGHPSRCYDMLRMDRDMFVKFCLKLRNGYLTDSRYVSVEESVAMFLNILGHNEGHRVIAERFQHSTETVSKNFKKVLKAVCRLGKELIRPPTRNNVPPEIRGNPKYYPWFKNCIGAIDGTHVSARAPASKHVPYRGRKTVITQNVMCACSFDMMFTYVYTGWEGTANDARIFVDAVTRADAAFPMPDEGKYYVVDSGYPCTTGFLPPYRGERYHLKEYRGRGRHPTGPKELFNYRHSSLRNVIERCFGVLKARFPILKLMPQYKLTRQRLIVNTCCVVHNFIRNEKCRDRMFEEYGIEDLIVEDENITNNTRPLDAITFSDERAAQMARTRDEIATSMWNRHTGRS